MCDLTASEYTVRFEHIEGAGLQIDAIPMRLENGADLATWGGVKSLYE
jgi:hypothetical protein